MTENDRFTVKKTALDHMKKMLNEDEQEAIIATMDYLVRTLKPCINKTLDSGSLPNHLKERDFVLVKSMEGAALIYAWVCDLRFDIIFLRNIQTFCLVGFKSIKPIPPNGPVNGIQDAVHRSLQVSKQYAGGFITEAGLYVPFRLPKSQQFLAGLNLSDERIIVRARTQIINTQTPLRTKKMKVEFGKKGYLTKRGALKLRPLRSVRVLGD